MVPMVFGGPSGQRKRSKRLDLEVQRSWVAVCASAGCAHVVRCTSRATQEVSSKVTPWNSEKRFLAPWKGPCTIYRCGMYLDQSTVSKVLKGSFRKPMTSSIKMKVLDTTCRTLKIVIGSSNLNGTAIPFKLRGCRKRSANEFRRLGTLAFFPCGFGAVAEGSRDLCHPETAQISRYRPPKVAYKM